MNKKEKLMDIADRIEIDKEIEKTVKKYIGLWVALDDKDRLLSFGKERVKVLDDATSDMFLDKNAGIRLYKIFSPYTKDMIKGLLDYGNMG